MSYRKLFNKIAVGSAIVLILFLLILRVMFKPSNQLNIVFKPKDKTKIQYTISTIRKIVQQINGVYDEVSFKEGIEIFYDINFMNPHYHNYMRVLVLDYPDQLDNSLYKKVNGLLSNQKFELIIEENSGALLKILGTDSLNMSIENELRNHSFNKSPQLLRNFYNDDYIRNLYENDLNISAVGQRLELNTKWNREELMVGSEPLKFTTHYCIKAITDSEIVIESTSFIDQMLNINRSTQIRILGNKNGEMRIERASGILVSKNTNIIAEGQLKKGKMSIFFKLIEHKEINSK